MCSFDLVQACFENVDGTFSCRWHNSFTFAEGAAIVDLELKQDPTGQWILTVILFDADIFPVFYDLYAQFGLAGASWNCAGTNVLTLLPGSFVNPALPDANPPGSITVVSGYGPCCGSSAGMSCGNCTFVWSIAEQVWIQTALNCSPGCLCVADDNIGIGIGGPDGTIVISPCVAADAPLCAGSCIFQYASATQTWTTVYFGCDDPHCVCAGPGGTATDGATVRTGCLPLAL